MNAKSLSACPSRVLCAGNLFAMLTHDCFEYPTGTMGLLYGTKTYQRNSAITDAQEEVHTVQSIISITGYKLCDVTDYDICHSATLHRSVVGVFLTRHDGITYPSFRSMAYADKIKSDCDKTETISNSCLSPLILVVNAPLGTRSWIVGLSYGLWGVLEQRFILMHILLYFS